MNSCFVTGKDEKLNIDDDLFDVLWNSLDEDNSEEIAQAKKKLHNDKNNEKHKQNGYIKNISKTIALYVTSAEERQVAILIKLNV